MIDIFIPSYKRSDNLRTVNYYARIGWDMNKVHVVIDSEADDKADYDYQAERIGFNLHVFDMEEARRRYDYVHRPSVSRRSAGQARNMFYEIAEGLDIKFFIMQDDDTHHYQNRSLDTYRGQASFDDVNAVFEGIRAFMIKRRIGVFGVSQTGDFIGGVNTKLLRNKVMNTTFIYTPYIYRGERGVQDDDTSQFVTVMNDGLFTGSLGDGILLQQTQSATAEGGLTDLYKECKLLNKALVCPIQFPSSIHAERQGRNGGRVHHRIRHRNLAPRLLKGTVRDNIAWDTYPEDTPFTNEPKRTWKQ